jgi:hypothetical protein
MTDDSAGKANNTDNDTPYWYCNRCDTSWPVSEWQHTRQRRLRSLFPGSHLFWHRCPNRHWHAGAAPDVWRVPRSSLSHRADGTLFPRLGG